MAALMSALLIGVIAGLRAFTAPAAIAWAAHFGVLKLGDAPVAFMGYAWTPWIFTALALVELVTDQLPSTPSRKTPPQFGARLAMGALSGACLGVGFGSLTGGLVAGAFGAVIGTIGGAEVRRLMAGAFRRDPPAALIEDAAAIAGAAAIVLALLKAAK